MKIRKEKLKKFGSEVAYKSVINRWLYNEFGLSRCSTRAGCIRGQRSAEDNVNAINIDISISISINASAGRNVVPGLSSLSARCHLHAPMQNRSFLV